MAIYRNTTITVGNNGTDYGYNNGNFGSIGSNVYMDMTIQIAFFRASGDTGTYLGLIKPTGEKFEDGRFGYVEIGGTRLYREDATSFSDVFGVDVWRWFGTGNLFGTSGTVNLKIGYVDPDTGITYAAPTQITENDQDFDVDISGINNDADYGYVGYGYAVTTAGGGDTSERDFGTVINPTTENPAVFATGSSLSVNISNDLPAVGSSKTYYIYASRTGATGGAGGPLNEGVGAWVYTGNSFTVQRVANNTQLTNPPTATGYGFAIYDSTETLVTSFQENHTVFREIFNGTATVSTGSTTNVATGLTGLSVNNSIIAHTARAGNTLLTANAPARFDLGTDVRIARASDNSSVKVQVLQYKDTTIGASNNYGMKILNGSNNTVMDENAFVYGIKEIINLSAITWNWVTSGSIRYGFYDLAPQYGGTGGMPIIAINSVKKDWLFPPVLYGTPGNYKVIVARTLSSNESDMNIAILTSSTEVEPDYDGSTNYGVKVLDSSGNLAWHSAWRQAVINNIQDVNVFTTGVSQNSTWDVSIGADGVTPPAEITSTSLSELRSTGEILNFYGQNEMDPINTYVIGSCCGASVKYSAGNLQTSGGTSRAGGGQHALAAKITGTKSFALTMYRYGEGDLATPGTRAVGSFHPQGHILFARIV